MAASRTVAWRRASTLRASRCTTPPRCHTSPWPVPAQPRHTTLAVEMAFSARGWRAMEIVTAHGTARTISRADDGDRFAGAVVALGGLGVVTGLTLDVSPTFDMYQVVYENLPLAQVEKHFEAIMSSGYSVSLFSDWRESRFNQAWIKTG